MADKEPTSVPVMSDRCEAARGDLYKLLWKVAGLVIGVPLLVYLWYGSSFVNREIFDVRMSAMQEDIQLQTANIKDLRIEINSLRRDLMKTQSKNQAYYRTGVSYVDKTQRPQAGAKSGATP